MSKEPADIVFRKAHGILERDIGDGSIAVLSIYGEAQYYVIDAVAADFWNMIDGRKPLSKIKAKLIQKHRPPIKEFDRGLKTCIRDLEKHALIQRD